MPATRFATGPSSWSRSAAEPPGGGVDLAISVASAALLIDADERTTVAELAEALGQPDLYVGPRRLNGSDSLPDAGVLCGVEVGAGRPTAGRPPRCGPLEVAVVGGPSAGGRVDGRPGDVITIGRSGRCQLRIDDPSVSRRHAQLALDSAGAWIRDCGSSNGVGFGGRRLRTDQWISLGEVVEIGDSIVTFREVGRRESLVDPPDRDGMILFHGPPRFPGAADDPEMDCPAEPAPPTGTRFPLVSVVAPAVIGGALAALLRNPMFLAFIALSPVFAASNYFSDRRNGRADYRAKRAAYERALVDFNDHLAMHIAVEEKRRREARPDPAAALRIATTHSTRLWERRPGDDDFLRLRVGLHDAPARVRLRPPGGFPGPLAPGAPVVPVAPVARLLPASFDLLAAGVAGIAAARPARLAQARWLVTQAAVLHSPADLRIVVLTGPDEGADWEWAAWLPHLVPPDSRFACRRLVGAGRAQVESRVAELLHLIDERPQPAGSSWRDDPSPGPIFLVVVDGARRMRAVEGLADLLRRGPERGVVALCLEESATSLPQESRVTVASAGRRSLCTPRAGVRGVIGDALSAVGAEEIARALAPVRDATPSPTSVGGGILGRGQTDLPPTVRLLDLLGLGDPTAADVVTYWNASGGSDARGVIGAGATGPFVVDLVRDGPHGLVAGTTGAGKSELLQSLVAGLALNQRPDRLNFVLVDYKGGSAFKDCALLPHCVGLVTDLDGHLATRALASLSAELKRRELVLGAAGVSNIEDYWASPGQERTGGPGHQSGTLPRLVIVIDEFATLVEEVPDFVRGIIGIGMRGRSLGVHVVLATQRPAGVVSAELRANVNLRICLRVANPEESVDVIDSADAARIARDTPGRAYALTGYGDLTPFQAGRVAVSRRPAPLRAAARRPVRVEPLTLPALGGTGQGGATEDPDQADETDLGALVSAVQAAAEQERVAAPPGPWLPPLPELVTAAELGSPTFEPGGLSTVLGLADRPAAQRQDPFVVDVARTGSVLIVGTPGSGRSTALRTVAAGLARAYSPCDLHLYAIDCGDGALQILTALPHCGAVVGGDEAERLGRLIDRLQAIVARRGPARTVVLVDRLELFAAEYAERDGGRLVDTLDRLLREGRSAGLTFVLAGDRTAFTSRLASAVESRLVLRQADRGDYALLGLDRRAVPHQMPAGRAVWAQTGTELQIAMVGPDHEIPRIARHWSPAPEGQRPRRVDPLPARLDLAALGPSVPGGAVVTIGVGGDELAPVRVDLAEVGPGFLVSGPARSGRSTALACMIQSLPAGRAVVVCPRRSPLRGAGGLARRGHRRGRHQAGRGRGDRGGRGGGRRRGGAGHRRRRIDRRRSRRPGPGGPVARRARFGGAGRGRGHDR